MDSQGLDYIDYHRFQLCFFQIADAWAKDHEATSYVEVLTDLLSRASVINKDKTKRVWKWERGDEESTVKAPDKPPTPKSPKRTPKR